jgi:hypothetical protein
MDDIAKEINEIGRIIAHSQLIDAIKGEVRAVMGDKRATVIGGDMADSPEFEVVVRHRAGAEVSGSIARRLGAMKDIEVEQIERIADSVVGVRRKKE